MPQLSLPDLSSSSDITTKTFIDLCRSRAEAQPDQTAFTLLKNGEVEVHTVTYAALDQHVRAIAAHLQEFGLEGSRALLLYTPGIHFIEAFLGCFYAGIIPVPVYPPQSKEVGWNKLLAVYRDCAADLVLAEEKILLGAGERLSNSMSGVKFFATDTLAKSGSERWVNPNRTVDDLAFLQYTSGSTGTPKGVMVSHGNLIHNAIHLQQGSHHDENSCFVGWLPLYHDMGLMGNILQPIFMGVHCVLMTPMAFLQKPQRWLEAISKYRATTSGGPNFAYELCLSRISEADKAKLDLSCWVHAFNGAEPVRADTLERFAKGFASCGFRPQAFYPCYGMAEATLFVTGTPYSKAPEFRKVNGEALEHNRIVPVAEDELNGKVLAGSGIPWGDVQIEIVNPATLERCEADEVGEIWVKGPNICLGYWNRTEQTQADFGGMLDQGQTGPFLRTGDLGFLDGAELFVTGRLKEMIIIRGRNHYPQDIENTVQQSHPAMRRGAGAAFSVDVGGEERLVIVQEVDRNFLRNLKIEAVVQTVGQAVAVHHELRVHELKLIKPTTLPKTSSGKIMRRGCRSLYLDGKLNVVGSHTWTGAEDQQAETFHLDRETLYSLEETSSRKEAILNFIRACLASKLRIHPHEIPADKPINAMGLDSLMAVEMQHTIQSKLGLDFPITRLLGGATLADLAVELTITFQVQIDMSSMSARVPGHGIQRECPLSFNQRAQWFLYHLAPDSAAYRIALPLRIKSSVDLNALKETFHFLMGRHPALRTTYKDVEGQPIQRVLEDWTVDWRVIAAHGWSEEALDEHLTQSLHRPLDLTKDPVFRVEVYELAPRDVLVFLVFHHIAIDMWSLMILLEDLDKVYPALLTKKAIPLAPLTHNYTDFVQWQKDGLSAEEGERLWHYWRKQLAGDLPVLNLPTDRPRPAVQTYNGAAFHFQLSPQMTARLKDFSRENRVTMFVSLLAAYQILLHRYTGQDDILTGSPVVGRSRPEFADVVGDFMDPVVIRGDFSSGPSLSSALQAVNQVVLAALAHADFPFELLAERLTTTRDPSITPIFQTLFTLQKPHVLEELSPFVLGADQADMILGGMALESHPFKTGATQFDLMLTLVAVGDRYSAKFDFNTDLFNASTIQRMADHYLHVLNAMLDQPQEGVDNFALLVGEERLRVLVEWNATASVFPMTEKLHERFERKAVATPNEIALVFEDREITYRELDESANQVAHYLQSRGIGPDIPVAVCLERTPALLSCLLGALKAGGCYVPLDPAFPSARLTTMLADSHAPILMTDHPLLLKHFRGRISGSVTVVNVDTEKELIESQPKSRPESAADSTNLAYVIYTSGSTGRPKGVMVSHRNVVNFFTGIDRGIDPNPEGALLAVTTASFDISVLELFWSLSRGLKLVLQGSQGSIFTGREVNADEVSSRLMDFSLFYFAAETDETKSGRAHYNLLIEGAKFADRHGFRAVWTPERHFHAFGGIYPNPAVTGAALSLMTENIEIRSGSVVLPLHNPVRVAEDWAVVDNLTNGRVGLSVASGWHANDFVLNPDAYETRRDVLEENLSTIRALWRGEAVTMKDGLGNEIQVKTLPKPTRPDIPIWVTAAGNPATFEVAGRSGSRVLTHLLGQNLDQLEDKIAVYRKAWVDAGHPGRGYVTLMLHTFVAEDLDLVREKVRGPFTAYLRTSADLMKNLARVSGLSLDDMTEEEYDNLLAQAFDRYFETSGLFGTPRSCLPMVERLKAVDVDEIGCLIDFGVAEDDVISSLYSLNTLKELTNARHREAAAGQESDYTLTHQLKKHNITHFQCTPSMASVLCQADPDSLTRVKKLLVGGEALSQELADKLTGLVDGTVHNMYGPTETTIWSTTTHVAMDAGMVTIGKPMDNTRIYILDQHFRTMPIGLPGELVIGGDGVVRGYLGRPDLTADRFVPDPHSGDSGGRLYRTGDLARLRHDGHIEFLGRLDYQVKIRGYRIELGEIESVIRRQPAVQDCVVIAREDTPGDPRLVAYLVQAHNHGFPRRHLAQNQNVKPPSSEIRMTMPNGLPVYHHNVRQIGILYEEIFKDESYLKHGVTIEDGDVVFDVGANIGMFSMFANAKAKDVSIYCFEPIPPTFRTLSANMGLHDANAMVINAGLSDKTETVTFTYYPKMSGLSGRFSESGLDMRMAKSLIAGELERVQGLSRDMLSESEINDWLKDSYESEKYECELTTLSTVIEENHIKRIDLLKIDVEKSEMLVLRGIRDQHWPIIKQLSLEVDGKDNLAEASELLQSKGFQITVEDLYIAEASEEGPALYVYMLYATRPEGYQPPPREPHQLHERVEPTMVAYSEAELRAGLQEALPDYMMPSDFVLLDAVPRTANGKVDRKALPAPGKTVSEDGILESEAVPPKGEAEQKITAIWKKVLGRDSIGATDNFFELGGTSLLMARVLTLLRDEFSRDITIVELFRYPTIRGLAATLDHKTTAPKPKFKGASSRVESRRNEAAQRTPSRRARRR